MGRKVAGLVALLWSCFGLGHSESGSCVAVWVDKAGQPAECSALNVDHVLKQYPKTCAAPSPEKAAVRLRLTRCVEQVAAAVAPPGLTVAGREFVVRAEAMEGARTKELAGHHGESWQGAVRDLCRAIAVWHDNRSKPD